MADYLVLLAPSANRVYAQAAPRLSAAELRIVADAVFPQLGLDPADLEPTRRERIGGVDYLAFSGPDLPDRAVVALSNLSTMLALFRRADRDRPDTPASEDPHGDGLEWLRPIPLTPLDRHPDDLLTILKYRGKTNEQLTKLLLNITVMATDRPLRLLERRLTVLDPLCGRGTTLNQALSYGLDAVGVDLDGADFEAYRSFLTTWLRTHRYKHQASAGALRVDGRQLGRRFEVEFAADKAQLRAGQGQRLRYLCTDTTALDGLLPAGSVDVVVADTPYGVAHGSHGDRLARSPVELLRRALPGWVRVLRPGGAVGLAINCRVAPREDVIALLHEAGLRVCRGGGYDELRHRVDQTIERDLLVGVRD